MDTVKILFYSGHGEVDRMGKTLQKNNIYL